MKFSSICNIISTFLTILLSFPPLSDTVSLYEILIFILESTVSVYDKKWCLHAKTENDRFIDSPNFVYQQDHIDCGWGLVGKGRARSMARKMMNELDSEQEDTPVLGYWKGRPVGVGTGRLLVLAVRFTISCSSFVFSGIVHILL